MSRHADLTGRKFGNLTVVGYAESKPLFPSGQPQRHWKCSCTCGGTAEVPTKHLTNGNVWHCPECNPTRGADYMGNYEYYRARFTPAQRAMYDSIMKTRSGWRAEAEAVDWVMRETIRERSVAR